VHPDPIGSFSGSNELYEFPVGETILQAKTRMVKNGPALTMVVSVVVSPPIRNSRSESCDFERFVNITDYLFNIEHRTFNKQQTETRRDLYTFNIPRASSV
jgi:hypothetical protein